jgi:hypothetical protein
MDTMRVLQIRKRDGSLATFDPNKIKGTIRKALVAVTGATA